MKKERKKPILAGVYILDGEGNKVAINPKEDEYYANQCAAVAKTIETGIVHKVALA